VNAGNLRVTGGERVLIVGAAGVGTSRLAATVLGEVAPGAGRVEVLGHDVRKLRRSSLRLLRRRVGIVPQDLCLLEDRSAHLNVVLPLEIDGIPRSMSSMRAATVLALLGLDTKAALPVNCLSMSDRQRLAVARALVREPELVIADQPTSAQDAEGAELVCGAIAAAAARGAACLVLGRDPALRVIAEREGWRQLALVGGKLRPLSEIALEGLAIDDLLVDVASAPAPVPALAPVVPVPAANAPVGLENVVPFPITRVAGVR